MVRLAASSSSWNRGSILPSSPRPSHEGLRGVPSGSPDASVILWVGRIQSLKGTALAVASWLELDDPRSHLVVVGGPSGDDGDREFAEVRRLAEDAGASDRLHLVGPRPQIELGTYYRAANLTLVPSESETFGLVALESLACATPVVATRTGGLAEIVDDGRTGALVDERTPRAFADRMALVLRDPVVARRMGERGARRARGRTWAHTANDFLTSLADLSATPLDACASCA